MTNIIKYFTKPSAKTWTTGGCKVNTFEYSSIVEKYDRQIVLFPANPRKVPSTAMQQPVESERLWSTRQFEVPPIHFTILPKSLILWIKHVYPPRNIILSWEASILGRILSFSWCRRHLHSISVFDFLTTRKTKICWETTTCEPHARERGYLLLIWTPGKEYQAKIPFPRLVPYKNALRKARKPNFCRGKRRFLQKQKQKEKLFFQQNTSQFFTYLEIH